MLLVLLSRNFLQVNLSPVAERTKLTTAKADRLHDKAKVSKFRSAFVVSPEQTKQRARITTKKNEYSKVLINSLLALSSTNTLTEADLQHIFDVIQRIVAQGGAAVPAIREFLESGQNSIFSSPQAGAPAEFSSLRVALLEALGAIGGSEAEDVLSGVLKKSADPAEVAAAARLLEEQAPGQYRKTILHSVRRALAAAAQGPMPGDLVSSGTRDAAPLFKMLQKSADLATVAELESVLPWYQHYATVALGNLPEGKGVKTLSRIINSFTTPRSESERLALRIVTQVAVANADAREDLLAKVRADQIPDEQWPMLAEVIAGEHQLQIEKPEASGQGLGSVRRQQIYAKQTVAGRQTQVLYSVHRSAALSAEEFKHRIALLSQLAMETSNPIALRAIDDAMALLQGL